MNTEDQNKPIVIKNYSLWIFIVFLICCFGIVIIVSAYVRGVGTGVGFGMLTQKTAK